MNHQRKAFGRYVILVATGLALAGCSGWSYSPPLRGLFYSERINTPDVQAIAPSPNASPFNQALTKEYASLADSLMKTDNDPADSDYFARKGIAAAHGAVVPPENDANWGIATPVDAPVGYRVLLGDARKRLVADLDGGARERQPQLAARAQVLYDCWVEHMEQSWWTALNGPCHRDLLIALDQLEGHQAMAAPAAREYRVYFEFDRSNLTSEGAQIVQQAAAAAKADPSVRIVLVGKADRSGTDAYNMGLSHRRASTVRAQLERDGLARNRVDERWVGEREPPVPTPDGVREPRNRVVEITLH